MSSCCYYRKSSLSPRISAASEVDLSVAAMVTSEQIPDVASQALIFITILSFMLNHKQDAVLLL